MTKVKVVKKYTLEDATTLLSKAKSPKTCQKILAKVGYDLFVQARDIVEFQRWQVSTTMVNQKVKKSTLGREISQ